MDHKKVNIEALLLMAKYDDGFKKRLFEDRDKALSESGIEFSPGEKLLLTNISDDQLAENIEEFWVPGISKKSLKNWTKAAAVILLLTSIAVSSSGCCFIRGATPGPRPIENEHTERVLPDEQSEQRLPPVQGLVPDRDRPSKPIPLPPAPKLISKPNTPPPVERRIHILRVYFEYDRSDLTDDAKETLKKNAKTLKNDIFGNIIIEGHCDERGQRSITSRWERDGLRV